MMTLPQGYRSSRYQRTRHHRTMFIEVEIHGMGGILGSFVVARLPGWRSDQLPLPSPPPATNPERIAQSEEHGNTPCSSRHSLLENDDQQILQQVCPGNPHL